MTRTTPPKAAKSPVPRAASAKPFRLSEYLPYHLSFTSDLLSLEQSRLLFEATGLSMPEWRVMAVIGSFQPLSTKTVASFTTMNKVAVSRAVSRLVQLGYVEREIDANDSRLLRLEFSAAGRKAYRDITTLVAQWSGTVLREFSATELRLLKTLLAKLRLGLRETVSGEWPLNDRQLFGEV